MTPWRFVGLRCLVGLVLCVGAAGSARAQSVELDCGERCEFELSSLRGILLKLEEPDIVLRVGGRFHWDSAFFREDVLPIDDATRVRRGRISFSGRYFEKVRTKIEYEFAPGREGWRHLWIQYAPTRGTWIRGGNFVAPMGLEDIGSSNDLTFMERGLPLALGPEYQTGLGLGARGKLGRSKRRNRWTVAAVVGVPPLGAADNDRHDSDHVGVTSRLTFAPFARRGAVLHFGGSVQYRKLHDGSLYRIRTRPESSLAPAFLNTGRLADVDDVITAGAELIGVLGPVSLQGEYLHSFLSRSAGRPDPDFFGGYAQLAWVVTGESRRYSRTAAVLGGVRPRSRWGALELAARYSHLDLNDETVEGGQSTNVSAAINWYVRQNLRLMFNFVDVNGRVRSTGVADHFQIFQLRVSIFL